MFHFAAWHFRAQHFAAAQFAGQAEEAVTRSGVLRLELTQRTEKELQYRWQSVFGRPLGQPPKPEQAPEPGQEAVSEAKPAPKQGTERLSDQATLAEAVAKAEKRLAESVLALERAETARKRRKAERAQERAQLAYERALLAAEIDDEEAILLLAA